MHTAKLFFRNFKLATLVLLATLATNDLFASEAQASESASAMEKIAQRNLGRDIAFRFRPHMMGMTGIRLESFRIAENEQYLADHPYLSPWAVSAESVDVRYNPLGFLIGRISLTSIDIVNAQVQISVDSELRNNFEDLAEQQKKNRFSNWIRAHQINIKDMRFNIFSELVFAEPVKYEVDNINVYISNVIKNKIADIDITAHTPGAVRQNVTIRGTIGPIISIARIEESPMDIKFRVKQAPLAFELAKVPESIMQDKRYRRTLALPESGYANISYDLKGDIWDNLKVDGLISLEDVVFASIDKELRGEPFNVYVKSNTEISLNKQLAKLNDVAIEMNEAKIAMKGLIEEFRGDNPKAKLTLYSKNIDLAKFNRMYPFFSEIYRIQIIQGLTELKLTADGNLKDGLALNGDFSTTKLQLADYDDKQKGKALDSYLKLVKPIIYFARRNEVTFEQIHLEIANSLIRVSGDVQKVTNLDRLINARIQSTMMDVKAIHEFFPFYDKFLPSTLSYDGHFSFDALASGDAKEGTVKGTADFSTLNFVIENLARKKGKSRLDITFEGGYDDYDSYHATGKVLLEKGELDNSVIYIDAMKHLLGGNNISAAAKSYLSKIDPQKIRFASSTASIKYLGDMNVDISLSVNNLHNAVQKNVALDLAGKFNVDDLTLNLQGQLKLPKEVYETVLQLNPHASRYLNADKSMLLLPLNVTGLFTEPKLQLQ